MKVTVCMTTYNHAAFIAEAIEGVMAQQTDFPVELIIGDDSSTDATEEICRGYAAHYPEKIKYLRRDKNIGMMPNFIDLLQRADGDYIALCDGDDKWIDEHKLQKQADALESDPSLVFAAHSHYQLQGKDLVPDYTDITEPVRYLTTTDYMLYPHFQTSSYFFRRSAMPEGFPSWYPDVLAGDHFLVLFLTLKGNIAFLNERMSVFRTSRSSVTIASGPLRIKDNFVKHLRIFDEETAGRFHEPLENVIRRWDLVYKPYEPVGYFSRLGHLIKNSGFYLKNYSRLGGMKLAAKYLLTYRLFDRIKTKVA